MFRTQQNFQDARSLMRCWLLVLLCVLSAPFARAQPDDVEARIKAAFLLNFARYVEWPESVFTSSNSPVVIGVLGQDPFGKNNLEAIVDGKTVEHRPVLVKRGKTLADLADCHILFISTSERERLRSMLTLIQAKPLLTVSDMEGFRDAGGIILLKRKPSGMRFEINREAAERAGLKLSSKLLKLADNYQ
jgi:hypothetical protein